MDQLANGVFHGVLFRPQAVARDAQVEKLGIIRGEGGLANRSRPAGLFKGILPTVGASLFAKIVNDNADIRVYVALSGFSRASSLLQG
ncbi:MULTISPECIES: hypothetical protein [Pseudomonas]|uniref:hypothetical protein n=1 Tax=Pseudomonas TaxID=286 RepID=UPI0015A07DAF|nr:MULTISPECIES: hypothetical protein [Pseudomonas]NWC55729.1 hypothetical protein [Pseudomonas veronii]UHG98439.1 hypothetical protein LQ249_02925 [Pseudomonas sp. 7-41]WKC44980.1 hypothetical protein QYP03_19375 [Pseudomonas veronii]